MSTTDWLQLTKDLTPEGTSLSPLPASWQHNAQNITYTPYPPRQWAISYPASQDLKRQLQTSADDASVEIVFAFTPTITSKGVTSLTSDSFRKNVNASEILDMIQRAENGETVEDIAVENLYPRCMKLSTTQNKVTNVDEIVDHWSTIYLSIVTHQQPVVSVINGTMVTTEIPVISWQVKSDGVNNTGASIIGITSQTTDVTSLLSSVGINSVVAFYSLIVLAVFKLIRSAFAMPMQTVPYLEIPYADELLNLCVGIQTARQARYRGHLKDEMKLFKTLLRICRSQERILRITKSKVD